MSRCSNEVLQTISAKWLLSHSEGDSQHNQQMDGASYRCCRCGFPLQVGALEEPCPCRQGCGEWLSREAVEELLLPELLTPIRLEAPTAAPRCILCNSPMRALLGAPYYLCVDHGIWFDAGWRESFARVLSEEIEEHRKLRAFRASAFLQLLEPGKPRCRVVAWLGRKFPVVQRCTSRRRSTHHGQDGGP